MLVTINAFDTLSRLGLDCNKSYFLFCGSFGDRWYIASFLATMLAKHPNSMVIADRLDEPLLQIFIGDAMSRVLVCNANTISHLRNICRQDLSCYMPNNNQLSSNGDITCPPGIRSLHIVDYPYFVHLSARGCVPYIDLLRLVCFLPIDSEPIQPRFLGEDNNHAALRLLQSIVPASSKSVIYNIANFSHKGMSASQQHALVTTIVECGYTPVINIAGLDDTLIKQLKEVHKDIPFISIPGHLVKSVFDQASAVVGVLGGALGIAYSFSNCPLLVFATQSNFFPGYTTALGQDHDILKEMNFTAQPDSGKERIYQSINMPNIENVTIDEIKYHVLNFFRKVSSM